MAGQPEVTNFIRSLKPFVNKQGVLALETLENVFDLLEDPKVQTLTRNIESFRTLMKEQYQQQNPNNDDTITLHSLLKSLRNS